MTYATNLKQAATAYIWKASGGHQRGDITCAYTAHKHKHLAKLWRYLERVNKRKDEVQITQVELDCFFDAAIDVLAAHYQVPRRMLIGEPWRQA